HQGGRDAAPRRVPGPDSADRPANALPTVRPVRDVRAFDRGLLVSDGLEHGLLPASAFTVPSDPSFFQGVTRWTTRTRPAAMGSPSARVWTRTPTREAHRVAARPPG